MPLGCPARSGRPPRLTEAAALSANHDADSPRRSMRRISNFAANPWISRRKSSAANRPSPSLSGKVLDVAASRTPCSASRVSSVDIKTVSPGSSEFEPSSIHTSAYGLSAPTVCSNPRSDEVRVLHECAVGAKPNGLRREPEQKRASGSFQRRIRHRGTPRLCHRDWLAAASQIGTAFPSLWAPELTVCANASSSANALA